MRGAAFVPSPDCVEIEGRALNQDAKARGSFEPAPQASIWFILEKAGPQYMKAGRLHLPRLRFAFSIMNGLN